LFINDFMTDQDVSTGEIMEFLQKNMMLRDKVKDFVRQELGQTESRILTSVDRFAKLHETLDQELVALRDMYHRLEEQMEMIEQKVGIFV